MKHVILPSVIFLVMATLCDFQIGRAVADISVAGLFSDRMVLQQRESVPIWGTSEPNEKLTIHLVDHVVLTTADEWGHWSAVIQTGPAGGPYQLQVASQEGRTKVVFNDVMIGEVWICAGDSNMHQPLSESRHAEEEAAKSRNYPHLRWFKVRTEVSHRPLDDFIKFDPWYGCTTDSVLFSSAVAFLFGRQLNQRLDVPIGLIDVSRPGTSLESWIPLQSIQREEGFDDLLRHWEERKDFKDPHYVSLSYNGMLSPLTRFPVRGVIWYQGESNAGRAAQYARLFPLMIFSWREKFQAAKLPVIFVQLIPNRYTNLPPEALPEMWDAQLRTLKSVPHTGMVVTLDLAERDTTMPQDMRPVADRLACWALSECYSDSIHAESIQVPNERQREVLEPIETDSGNADRRLDNLICSGPIFESLEIESDRIRITFRFAESGLAFKPVTENGFTICGDDQTFVPAQVAIDNGTVVVWHPEIRSPIAVRYAWKDTSTATLFNGHGLPASPFRTDQFRLTSEGVSY